MLPSKNIAVFEKKLDIFNYVFLTYFNLAGVQHAFKDDILQTWLTQRQPTSS